MHTWLKDHWLKVLAIIMVLLAVVPLPITLPYVYFQLMNWVVVGTALVTAYQAHKQGKDMIAWLFVAAAVVFNPLAPLYLTQRAWMIADIVMALLFAGSFVVMREKQPMQL